MVEKNGSQSRYRDRATRIRVPFECAFSDRLTSSAYRLKPAIYSVSSLFTLPTFSHIIPNRRPLPELNTEPKDSPMPRTREGSVYWSETRKSWIAQLDWTDDQGNRQQRKRQVVTKTEGKRLVKEWIGDLKKLGEAFFDA